MFEFPQPIPWIASQNDKIVAIIAAVFPFAIGVPFEVLGRRFGEIVGNGTGHMFQAVAPVTFFIALLISLCARFIVTSMDSMGALAGTVVMQAIIEIVNRGTLIVQMRFQRWMRGFSSKETNEYLESSQCKRYLASVIIARSFAEYVAIFTAMDFQLRLIGSEMEGYRLVANFGQTAGVPVDTGFVIGSTCIMLLTEIIVDMISFRVETSLHGLPLGEMRTKRRVSFLLQLGIIAYGAINLFYFVFIDREALRDCAAAANLTGTFASISGLNMCSICNASDISNTSDLYYMCFDAVRH